MTKAPTGTDSGSPDAGDPTLDFGTTGPGSNPDHPDPSDPTDRPDTRQPAETRRPGHDLVLIVDLAAFRRGNVAAGERCEIKGIGPVPVEIAHQWANDAFIKAVITNGRDVTHVAHLGRNLPADVRTALTVLHNACAVPGCTNTRVEYDHDTAFAEGGLTNTANLRPLCTYHHRQRTHENYELTGPPGDRIWAGPDGTILAAELIRQDQLEPDPPGPGEDPRKTSPPIRVG
jgi:hypothetical protein